MANWCDNTVNFTGGPSAISDINKLFSQIDQDQENKRYEMPEYITAENRLMIDISVRHDSIYYRTRWHPNLQALQQIADHFNVGFTNRYCEPDMIIWGEARYANGVGQDIHLDREDLNEMSYDFDNACYRYNGKTYEHDFDLMTDMLDAKIDKDRNVRQYGR